MSRLQPPWTAACLAFLWKFRSPITSGILHQLPELAQTHVHRVHDTIQPSHPLSSPSPPAFNLSQHQGLFQWVSSLHQVAKVLECQPQHQSFQWIFRLSSFRMDWLDLLAVQEALKNLLQHHSSKASILQCSAFFIVQFSHPYMTTEKTSLFCNILPRLVIAFLLRRKLSYLLWIKCYYYTIFIDEEMEA